MKLRNLIAIPFALALSYSAQASADSKTLEQKATLKNGNLASFSMNLDKSKCQLTVEKSARPSTLLSLTDYSCNGTVDEINISWSPNKKTMLVKSVDGKEYARLFKQSSKLYNNTLKEYNLRAEVESKVDKAKGGLESSIESYFK